MVFQSGSSVVLGHYEKLVWPGPLVVEQRREGCGLSRGGRNVGGNMRKMRVG